MCCDWKKFLGDWHAKYDNRTIDNKFSIAIQLYVLLEFYNSAIKINLAELSIKNNDIKEDAVSKSMKLEAKMTPISLVF